MSNDTFSLVKNNLAVVFNPTQFLLVRLILSITSIVWALLLFEATVLHNHLALVSLSNDLLNSIVPAWARMSAHFVQGIFGIVGIVLNARGKLFIIFDSLLAALLWSITSSLMIVGYLDTGHEIPPIFAAQITMAVFAIWAMFKHTYNRRIE